MSAEPIESVSLPASFDDLDPLLQHRSRLGTMVLLTKADAMTFTHLRQLLKETDGNLGAQLRKLEDAGYISVDKQFEQRKPVSWYALTTSGRKSLKRHLKALQKVFDSTG